MIIKQIEMTNHLNKFLSHFRKKDIMFLLAKAGKAEGHSIPPKRRDAFIAANRRYLIEQMNHIEEEEAETLMFWILSNFLEYKYPDSDHSLLDSSRKDELADAEIDQFILTLADKNRWWEFAVMVLVKVISNNEYRSIDEFQMKKLLDNLDGPHEEIASIFRDNQIKNQQKLLNENIDTFR